METPEQFYCPICGKRQDPILSNYYVGNMALKTARIICNQCGNGFDIYPIQ